MRSDLLSVDEKSPCLMQELRLGEAEAMAAGARALPVAHPEA